jgi:hypothetical protein
VIFFSGWKPEIARWDVPQWLWTQEGPKSRPISLPRQRRFLVPLGGQFSGQFHGENEAKKPLNLGIMRAFGMRINFGDFHITKIASIGHFLSGCLEDSS